MAFDYSMRNGARLTQAQEIFLDYIENLPSPFGGISCLKELWVISGVSVIVADRGYLINYLDAFVQKYGRNMEHFFYGSKDPMRFHRNQGEIGDRMHWAKEQLKNAKEPVKETMPLLGLYSRKLTWYSSNAPKVFLFADNINDYARSTGCNAENVFAYVFIHEMMHAYYDAFNNEGYPAVGTLEETFAEFGMLTFISKSLGNCPLLKDAKDHVISKIANGPREYGFGYEMFFRTRGDAPDMIERYRDISNWINYFVLNDERINYYDSIREYQINPNGTNADKCYDDVLAILDLDLTKPISPIQPGIELT